jgi:hypothetical protein
MIQQETVNQRKARIARAIASGHSGELRKSERPQLVPSEICTGPEFAAWLDGSTYGRSIYDIAAICGSLDAAYDYMAALGTSVRRDGNVYKLTPKAKRTTFPNVKGDA